jgi:hypothetical protein
MGCANPKPNPKPNPACSFLLLRMLVVPYSTPFGVLHSTHGYYIVPVYSTVVPVVPYSTVVPIVPVGTTTVLVGTIQYP